MSAPDDRVQLEQVGKYKFAVTFAEAPFPGMIVDEPLPIGGEAGPNPVQALARPWVTA